MIARLCRLASALCLALCAVPAAATQAATIAERTRVSLLTDPATALAEADAALATADRHLPVRADALWVRAQALVRMGERDEALATLERLRTLRLAGAAARQAQGRVSMMRGLLARQAGDFPEALNHYRIAQRHYIAAGDRRGQGQTLTALGSLYTDAGDDENAFRYLGLADEVYVGDPVYDLTLNNNYGVALVNAKRSADAVRRFRTAAALADRLGVPAYAATIRKNIAIAQLELGQLDAATMTLARIGSVGREPDLALWIEITRTEATLALRRGDPARAQALIESIFRDTALNATDARYRFAHTAAYEIYQQLGRPGAALPHLEAVRRLDFEASRLIASNRAALLAAQFGYDAQEARINQLKAEQLERDIAFERQRNAMQRTFVIVVLIASFLLLSLLSALLWLAVRARNQARRDGAALAVSHAQLERALAAKSEFLATTSHEMRTPLNGIVGMTQILLADPALPHSTRERVELIGKAGGAMRALVDDLLDVAKIEHGGFTITPAPARLAPIIAEVVAQATPTAELEGLCIDSHVDLPDEDIMIDAGRVRQIIVNLVGNAVKFTQQGGIAIAAHLVDGDDGDRRVHIRVSDSGPGIAPEWHEAVFELFRQIDGSRTRQHGGTGLGLPIARQLARGMDGDIRIESRMGRGTSFIVDLPWHVAEPVAAAAPPEVDASLWLMAADPLRSALLATMVRRSGQPYAPIAATSLVERLRARDSAAEPLTLMIDSRSLGDIAIAPEEVGLLTAHRVIIVGDVDEPPAHLLRDCGISAAFALNALLPLLGGANRDSKSGQPENPPLQFAPVATTLPAVAPQKQKRVARGSDGGG